MRVRQERRLPVAIAVWNGVFGGNAMQPDVRCIEIRKSLSSISLTFRQRRFTNS